MRRLFANTLRSVLVTTVLCAAVLLASGCKKLTCARICECSDHASCEDTCESTYSDGDSMCKQAMRNYGTCLEDQGCGDLDFCYDMFESAESTCPDEALDLY